MGERIARLDPSRTARLGVLLTSAAVYLVFGFTAVAAIGFTARIIQPQVAASRTAALFVDIGFVALFGLQHSVMARGRFKERWLRLVPAPLERSVYVLSACLLLLLMVWQWRAVDQTLWDVQGIGRAILWIIFVTGWAVVFYSTFLIDHFDLVGLRQAWSYYRGQPIGNLDFRTPSLYRVVRHPMMVGFILLYWANPTMTLDMFVLAVAITTYIIVGVIFEERDLLRWYGARYRTYRQRTPMLIPLPVRLFRRANQSRR